MKTGVDKAFLSLILSDFMGFWEIPLNSREGIPRKFSLSTEHNLEVKRRNKKKSVS